MLCSPFCVTINYNIDRLVIANGFTHLNLLVFVTIPTKNIRQHASAVISVVRSSPVWSFDLILVGPGPHQCHTPNVIGTVDMEKVS